MRLPIDRFQLLGISAGTKDYSILTQVEKKCEKCPYPGFSMETLRKRKEIIVNDANHLLDLEKRVDYEKDYTRLGEEENDRKTIPIQQGYEVAGLLLLLEAGDEENCILLAEKLCRDQRMSLGSLSGESREINRIIDFATLEYSRRLKRKRHYEASAAVLKMRLTKCGEDIGNRDILKTISDELTSLFPYQILDLLSRANDEESHQKGITLLNTLINERGTLESSSNRYMLKEEFPAFFRQIRSFLTVQEQISLYEGLRQKNSLISVFLLSISLVAQGFAQRKPQRIYDALKIIEQIRSSELEPVIANMYLLIGRVNEAIEVFNKHADDDLKLWASRYSKEELGALCGWCRSWLSRDVLNGFRDIDIDPDLEAYFSDEDVVSYIEESDRLFEADINKGLKKNFKHDGDSYDLSKCHDSRINNDSRLNEKMVGKIVKVRIKDRLNTPVTGFNLNNTLVFTVIALATTSLMVFARLERTNKNTTPPHHSVSRAMKSKITNNDVQEDQIIKIIARWHEIKQRALSENKLLRDSRRLASPSLIAGLQNEIDSNIMRGERRLIDVKIEKIKIIKADDNNVRISARLQYKEKTVNKENKVIDEISEHSFTRNYGLSKENGQWFLVE